MADSTATQTQTLSLRISESLQSRLEQIRDLVSARKGEKVSTSEIAKQLLEGSKGQMEEVELHRQPTETLQAIWRKVNDHRPLSKAEWTVLAYYIQQGAEIYRKNPLSSDTYIGILQAFQSLYRVRTGSTERAEYYLKNLSEASKPEGYTGQEALERATNEVIRRLRNPSQRYSPTYSARILYGLLHGEEFTSVEAVNEALLPHWDALWRAAARGHFHHQKEPLLLDSPAPDAWLHEQPLPQFHPKGGRYGLSVARGKDLGFMLLINCPGPMGAMYPLSKYPKIAEFRAMLAGLKPTDEEGGKQTIDSGMWDGEIFHGYIVRTGESAGYWFRAHEGQITFGFTEQEWEQLKELFEKAWSDPEVHRLWQQMALAYGEL